MTSNDPEDPSNVEGTNALMEQVNEDSGEPITYACEYHTGNDPLNNSLYDAVAVEQFYDLMYPCLRVGDSTDRDDIVRSIAETLLTEAAYVWSILPYGEACSDPESKIYGAWLFGVTSEGPDTFINDFGCQRLKPNATNNECCQVVRAEMQFFPTGDYNITNLRQFMADRLNSGEAIDVENYRTAAIDRPSSLQEPDDTNDEARANLDEPTRVTDAQDPTQGTSQTQQSAHNREITVTGGFVIAMIVASCLGAFFLAYRAIRKPRRLSERVSCDGKDDDFCDSTMDQGPSCEDSDFNVAVVQELPSTDAKSSCLHVRSLGSTTAIHSTNGNNHTKNSDNLLRFDLPLDDDYPPAQYTFDLSDTFKQNVMGTYAPTTMQVVAPYPMLEDTSYDSEVDSWAQTDGTVGSLEDRLEEITAEI
jgi:hypothetical protein